MGEGVSASGGSAPGTIGARLKALRASSGRSLEELGRELGVHFTTISSWERGRSRPNYRTLARLAALYQVSPEYLLEEFSEGATPGRLVSGPTTARFRRIADRDREYLAGGLEEVRFLLLVKRVLDRRGIRLDQLGSATGISLTRLDGLLIGQARPTVSEVLHLSDALGIRIEERSDGEGEPEFSELPTEPESLVKALQGLPPPAKHRLVRWLHGAIRLAVGDDTAGRKP
jgi:transcriptional regulator with XRE-family HTH domain